MRQVWSRLLVGLVVLAGLRESSKFAPYPDIENKTFIKEYIDAHNKFRSEVKPPATDMLYMSFDVALARIAKAYAKKCIWEHNEEINVHPDPKFRPFGENMWMGSASTKPFNVAAAIGSFHSEIKYYDYNTHRCTQVCGHYTQVVWAASYKVGCAIAFCKQVVGHGKNLGILVCDYAPAGNYRGVRPYKSGRSCSACPKGNTCQNNLCRSPQRDQENSKDQQFIQDCVNQHNNFRSKVKPSASNMRLMTWDPALAKTAKAWTKKCHFGHNIYLKTPGKVHPNFTPVGENIWTGSLSLFSVEKALLNWYNEVNDYKFESNVCTRVCGHYTQVVWATSYKLGCAVQFCERVSGYESLSNGAHFVCNYGPAGNYPTKPYRTGRPCSDCRGEKCVRNLCENPERDQLRNIGNVQFIEECVRVHNNFRSSVTPPASNMKRMMVWATSYKIGCAVHFCPAVKKFKYPNAALFICNYGPGGNYPTKPYKTGAACSECHGEPCIDRLCGKAWEDPVCDQYCITVLTLRPSLLLVILAAVLFVKQRYPEMYTYK
ncbi:hypothetical protein JD844_028013 [Phrynosoma platyrhinos]|uniref:SCP domain-containing protein n=1 Tax=Phrynosoma platyrhinos TaxID=52577 RepID=A0ABQ7SHA1_PHRPL|nr:hypothetical protein JD844_028013 [Phrynosoma platyrhinos]